jgi:hypothetical protein
LNRRIIDWEIEETTLAIFKYRNTDDGTTKVSKTNFGERYTIPKENMSDIETILLAGITFTPTKFFGVRLLVSPSQLEKPYEETSTDFHWWISVTLRP